MINEVVLNDSAFLKHYWVAHQMIVFDSADTSVLYPLKLFRIFLDVSKNIKLLLF